MSFESNKRHAHTSCVNVKASNKSLLRNIAKQNGCSKITKEVCMCAGDPCHFEERTLVIVSAVLDGHGRHA